MKRTNGFSCRFFPVGQGLFSSGSIFRAEAVPWHKRFLQFLWVYDCGTSSFQQLVDDGLDELALWAESRPSVDLLFLSHFDHDHISGICRLLKRFKVETLVLPYMPLHQRILLAFEEGAEFGDDLMAFTLDPVGFLALRADEGIGRILFVPASGDEGPPIDQGVEPPATGGESDDRDVRWDIDFDRGRPEDDADADEAVESVKKLGRPLEVAFLKKGGRITVRRLWEFVPYNDDLGTVIDDSFRWQVENHRRDLLGAANDESRTKALKELKAAYDAMFGRSSRERNVISLFVYSGPIYPSWRKALLGSRWNWCPSVRDLVRRMKVDLDNGERDPRERCSIVYTGDGYLDKPEALSRLVRFWSVERINRCGIFQVMHHGAEGNWHKGVAEAVNPLFSIFSSNPERKRWGHPHAAVVRDFWRHGPVQVDKVSGFTAYGCLD